MIQRLLILLLLTGLALASPLSGMVVTGVNPAIGNAIGHGDPLSGVEIQVEGTEFRTVSSANGLFYFQDLPNGEYRLKAHKTGFPETAMNVRV